PDARGVPANAGGIPSRWRVPSGVPAPNTGGSRLAVGARTGHSSREGCVSRAAGSGIRQETRDRRCVLRARGPSADGCSGRRAGTVCLSGVRHTRLDAARAGSRARRRAPRGSGRVRGAHAIRNTATRPTRAQRQRCHGSRADQLRESLVSLVRTASGGAPGQRLVRGAEHAAREGGVTPWVLRLIVANVIVFFIELTAPALVSGLAFVPTLILFRPWTLITYMFLHAGMTHILFNMLGLYFFGPRVEERLG